MILVKTLFLFDCALLLYELYMFENHNKDSVKLNISSRSVKSNVTKFA